MILFMFSGKFGCEFNLFGPYAVRAISAGKARTRAAVKSGAVKMTDSKSTVRVFGRRANPTIAFDPESEIKAIEKRRKAAIRAERTRARGEKTSAADGRADVPSSAKPVKPGERRYLIAGIACLALAMTLAVLAPQVLTAALP
jgi:hypothetical protein